MKENSVMESEFYILQLLQVPCPLLKLVLFIQYSYVGNDHIQYRVYNYVEN